MSPKPGFFKDTFEQLVELGTSTGKKVGQSVAQTFSPLKIAEKITHSQSSCVQSPENPKSRKDNHTPLNFEKLQEQYQEEDEKRTAALRQRLFQLVKRDEEKILERKHQEEAEKKRKAAYEEELKKREKEKKKQEHQQEIPRGKIRRSIFSPLKVAKRQTTETRPAIGKQ